MKHTNKREHLPIDKNEGQILLLVNCRYLFIFIKKMLDNNLIVNTKLERWLHYFKYNLYDILMKKFSWIKGYEL